jgi:hypothetical protein
MLKIYQDIPDNQWHERIEEEIQNHNEARHQSIQEKDE